MIRRFLIANLQEKQKSPAKQVIFALLDERLLS